LPEGEGIHDAPKPLTADELINPEDKSISS
jgi:hypothetical protein